MMEYRKVGRGGAGNYYSKKDMEDAAKKAAQQNDLEAQKSSVSPNTDSISSTQPKYATSGRGGAGNLTEASTLGSPPSDPADVSHPVRQGSISGPGHYGRGGAGNYVESELVGRPPQETELQDMKRQDTYADAETGLQEPKKAHLGGQKSADDVWH